MKYSMMSYTMTRQKERFDFDEMLRLTAELDLAGIDFFGTCGLTVDELRARVDDAGVPVVCSIYSANLAATDRDELTKALDTTRRQVDDALALGAPLMMVTTPGIEGVPRAASRKRWIGGLQEANAIVQDAGMTLTIENFPGANSPFVIADDVLEAMREVPGLKLTFDNGNAGSGEDPGQSFTRCAEHVVHAHFKDWAIVDETAPGARLMLDGRHYVAALIGEGDIDQAGSLAAMKRAGYDGCINIEYEGNDYPPADAVRRAVGYLRALEADLP
jgi:sugar phosphate isomerase/epimerase